MSEDNGAEANTTKGKAGVKPNVDLLTLLLAVIGAVIAWGQLPQPRAIPIFGAIVAGTALVLSLRRLGRIARKVCGTIFTIMMVVCLAWAALQDDESTPTAAPNHPDNSGTVSPAVSASTTTTPAALVEKSLSPSPSPSPFTERGEATIANSDSATFFNGDLRVGISGVYPSYASVSVATTSWECSGNPNIGESLVVVDRQERWNRVILQRTDTVSMKVSVLVIRGSGKPPSGASCIH